LNDFQLCHQIAILPPIMRLTNEQPQGIGVSTIGKRYAKLGFYLLLPIPAPLQRGFGEIFAYLLLYTFPTHRIDEVNRVYKSSFTEEEIRDLTTFFKPDTG